LGGKSSQRKKKIMNDLNIIVVPFLRIAQSIKAEQPCSGLLAISRNIRNVVNGLFYLQNANYIHICNKIKSI